MSGGFDTECAAALGLSLPVTVVWDRLVTRLAGVTVTTSIRPTYLGYHTARVTAPSLRGLAGRITGEFVLTGSAGGSVVLWTCTLHPARGVRAAELDRAPGLVLPSMHRYLRALNQQSPVDVLPTPPH